MRAYIPLHSLTTSSNNSACRQAGVAGRRGHLVVSYCILALPLLAPLLPRSLAQLLQLGLLPGPHLEVQVGLQARGCSGWQGRRGGEAG